MAQSSLMETMTLTGLDPKLGSVIRASNPQTILQAITQIKRELPVTYLETPKYQINNPRFNTQNRSQQIAKYETQ